MAQQSNMTITLLPWASQARKNAVAQNARANENVESRKLLLRFFTPAFMHLQIFRIFGVRMYAPGTWYLGTFIQQNSTCCYSCIYTRSRLLRAPRNRDEGEDVPVCPCRAMHGVTLGEGYLAPAITHPSPTREAGADCLLVLLQSQHTAVSFSPVFF